jgi:hypothetical protein
MHMASELTTPTPQATQKLPAAVLATRDRYVARFPMWTMPGGLAAENKARSWNIGLAKQIAYEHPGQNYGTKRAAKDRPVSKDAIAQQQGATLLCWDMLSGAGDGSPTVNANPDSQDITGQEFEYVEPFDVIAAGGPPPVEESGGGSASVPPYNEDYAIEFGKGCNGVYNESGAPMDPGMISVHSARAAWDYYSGTLPWPDSYKKHLNEFRAVYGLPPV